MDNSEKSDKKSTREKGNKAEDLAVAYLKKIGFAIVKRNFYFGRYGEIDIIAKNKETLVFVEVKSNYTNSPINPLDSITQNKQRQLRRAAEGYLYINKIFDQECRFDAVIVDFSKGEPQISHYENIIIE